MKYFGFVFLAAFLFFSNNGLSQNKLKFGHINSADLIKVMPERDSAEKALQKFGKELEDQLVAMNSELETKYTEFLKSEAALNDLVKQSKQKELQDMQQRIQDFQNAASDNYKKKQGDLLQPIIDKANEAIQLIGKEKGFTYIFDVSAGAVVFFSTDSEDVMPIVKAKLGIK
jgi:outer membrane protein